MEVIVVSNTVQKFNGESFYLCGAYFQRKGKRLHRAVWEHHNGEIPKGYHVHHKDGNRCNNDISNLILLKGSDHLSEHMQSEPRKAEARENIKHAINAAPAWHRTDKGRIWHSEQSKETWRNKGYNTYVCTYCGKMFHSRKVYGELQNRFCNSNCRSAFRRQSGIDNEERICPVCGKVFVVSRYSKNITCSSECARERRWKNEN